PTSAILDSPGPLTTQPITATLTGAVYSLAMASTMRASSTTSISARPHDGQAVMSKPFSRSPSAVRMPQATGTSSTGSAASETRSVSPMPSNSRTPSPMDDLIVPASGNPASVTPRWSG